MITYEQLIRAYCYPGFEQYVQKLYQLISIGEGFAKKYGLSPVITCEEGGFEISWRHQIRIGETDHRKMHLRVMGMYKNVADQMTPQFSLKITEELHSDFLKEFDPDKFVLPPKRSL